MGQVKLPHSIYKQYLPMRITRENFERFPDTALLSLEESSGIALRSVRSFRDDIRSGRIKSTKIQSQTRIEAGELRRFLREGGK